MKHPYTKPVGAPPGPTCYFTERSGVIPNARRGICPYKQPHPRTGDASCAAFGNTRLYFVHKCPACAEAHGEVAV